MSVTAVTVLLHFERQFLVRVFVGPDRRTQKAAMTGHGNSQKKTDENATIKLCSSHQILLFNDK